MYFDIVNPQYDVFLSFGTNTLCLVRLRLTNTSPESEGWFLQGIELKKFSLYCYVSECDIWLETNLLQKKKNFITL